MNDRQAIADLVELYFTFLHTGDPDLLAQLFLPECTLISPREDGSVVHLDLLAYEKIIRSRSSPQSAGYERFGRLLLVDQSCGTMAFAKVSCAVQPNFFTDYLTLVKKEGDWKIASKVYVLERTED